MTTSPLSASELRQLMQAFTRPVFNEMGRGLVPKAVSRAAELAGAAGSPLGAALQLSYEHLRKCYRAEYIYKNEIASKVVFAKHSPRTASLVSELRVGNCILDLAVFNGTSTAYEIKTQYDSLARLPEQLGEYLQVFDKVFVVTHLEGVEAALKAFQRLQAHADASFQVEPAMKDQGQRSAAIEYLNKSYSHVSLDVDSTRSDGPVACGWLVLQNGEHILLLTRDGPTFISATGLGFVWKRVDVGSCKQA